jgi:hypothetical protein
MIPPSQEIVRRIGSMKSTQDRPALLHRCYKRVKERLEQTVHRALTCIEDTESDTTWAFDEFDSRMVVE